MDDIELYREVLGLEPSTYQKDIFDFVVHGSGNAVVKAYAGSGKTATLIAAMKLVPPKKKCIFLAFNKSVKEEIEQKLVGHDNCTVKTVHGLGYAILSSYLEIQPTVDEFKYNSYLRHNINNLSEANLTNKDDIEEYCNNIIQLLEFSRMNLAQSKREIEKVAKEYGIPTENDEISVTIKLMKWGRENLQTMDFTDLVWLPYELDANPKQFKYDWIFNDEAQDYSVAYVKLFQRCFKRGTRFVSCGDEFQSINQFAGASEQAFSTMINTPNTQVFDLPMSYRCDRVIIKEANMFVPDIIARENAGLGLIKHDSKLAEIKGDDMVLSRTNAEMFKVYTRLIKLGKPCYIKGSDDDDKNKLLVVINRFNVNNILAKNFESDGLFPRMYNDMVNERNRMVGQGVDIIDAIGSKNIQTKFDTISSLLTLAEDCDTTDDLIKKINKIYTNTDSGICISTIHKAKGLEANNVHIVCRSTMPLKYAKTVSEIQQERNLIYVAITRAKHKLCYVSEKEFPPVRSSNPDDDLTEFNYIESMVCKLYNKEPLKPIHNAEIAKFRLNNATNIESIHKNDNRKSITQPAKKKGGLLDKLLDE